MLCIPPGTKEGWIGYAYFNWDLSVYNDNWCLYPSIQMHGELLGIIPSIFFFYRNLFYLTNISIIFPSQKLGTIGT